MVHGNPRHGPWVWAGASRIDRRGISPRSQRKDSLVMLGYFSSSFPSYFYARTIARITESWTPAALSLLKDVLGQLSKFPEAHQSHATARYWYRCDIAAIFRLHGCTVAQPLASEERSSTHVIVVRSCRYKLFRVAPRSRSSEEFHASPIEDATDLGWPNWKCRISLLQGERLCSSVRPDSILRKRPSRLVR